MAKRKKQTDVLADHQVGRVRMTMRDGDGDWRRPNDPFHVQAGDGLADGMHRPGFRVFHNDASREAQQVAMEDYERDLTNAWRDDSGINGMGSRGPRGQQEGDVCSTAAGSRGHLKTIHGELVCVPDPPGSRIDDPDAATSDGVAQRDAAYAEYDAWLAGAWRK